MSNLLQKNLNKSLYKSDLEHSSCGVGFVANIKGKLSNKILQYGLESACNVVHRGAISSDLKTGDGAGVLTHIPYEVIFNDFNHDIDLNKDKDDIAVGMIFLPSEKYKKAKNLIKKIVVSRNIEVIGWRKVPVNIAELGKTARDTMPSIEQLIIKKDSSISKDEFERYLYITRREITQKSKKEKIDNLYICSFSSRTIVYKALLIATALSKFFVDLQNKNYKTAICLYHQRFSTNTFPTWDLAQPLRMLAHNGEINTIRGNRNWMKSREADFDSDNFEREDIKYLRQTVKDTDSDSTSLDNVLELLTNSGKNIIQAMRMLVPPAWKINPFIKEEHKDFYKYFSSFSEPWDGPAALVYTDGRIVSASLDRNGLRPSRYKITKDDIISLGSEVGTFNIDDTNIKKKGRLGPGQMIAINIEEGKIMFDNDIIDTLSNNNPYGKWLAENQLIFDNSIGKSKYVAKSEENDLNLSQKQVNFDLNKEEINMSLTSLFTKSIEVTYSMGDDAALSVLSNKPKLISTYFKQLFAQVTNPPIDPIREKMFMSLEVNLGSQKNFLTETPEHAQIIKLKRPFLTEEDLNNLQQMEAPFLSKTIDIVWDKNKGTKGLEQSIDYICHEAEKAIDDNNQIIILSDRKLDNQNVAISSLLAIGAVHQHLIKKHKRIKAGIIVDTGEARDTHQIACLFGFGAQAVCPYLAFETIDNLIKNDKRDKLGVDYNEAITNYLNGLEKGVLKIMSKMGISILSSYQGAQIFEAIGLSSSVIDKCFKGVPSQVEGIGFEEVAQEILERHNNAFNEVEDNSKPLKLTDPGYNKYRKNGEIHALNRQVINNFHKFVQNNDKEKYNVYKEELEVNKPISLQNLLEFNPLSSGPIPIEEVESIEDIRSRFTTAAMSLGALGPETHRDIAIAMNRIGGKSDSGEGGEDPARFNHLPNGDWANSAIKQVASGRFGVSAEYLMNAQELEIKMAQGAKPGEGGQLPAHKVTSIIAKLRNTQPGVQLISPPPHHDIYSIEDLSQLIHDLKEINPRARICVKLVAVTGVGTIAAGVAKANADIILISGHEGGTGASPLSSIKHAGIPWVIGLTETQQVLMLNGLREKVTLRTDGGLKTGKDIVMAAILGAEEYNFGTMAMVALGCVYVRQCHLNNCPTGIATTDPRWRKKYKGKPEHLVNYLNEVAQECREILAQLGVKSLNQLIGRPSFLKQNKIEGHKKANTVDLSKILHDVVDEIDDNVDRYCTFDRNDGPVQSHPLDDKIILHAKEAINTKEPVTLRYKVNNRHRNIGSKLSGVIAYEYGNYGLPPDTVTINISGSAGQSFGTFLCSGIKLVLTGEANDYVGKSMCSGEIVIKSPNKKSFIAHENVIIGNTVLYGASGGLLLVNGQAGERFEIGRAHV